MIIIPPPTPALKTVFPSVPGRDLYFKMVLAIYLMTFEIGVILVIIGGEFISQRGRPVRLLPLVIGKIVIFLVAIFVIFDAAATTRLGSVTVVIIMLLLIVAVFFVIIMVSKAVIVVGFPTVLLLRASMLMVLILLLVLLLPLLTATAIVIATVIVLIKIGADFILIAWLLRDFLADGRPVLLNLTVFDQLVILFLGIVAVLVHAVVPVDREVALLLVLLLYGLPSLDSLHIFTPTAVVFLRVEVVFVVAVAVASLSAFPTFGLEVRLVVRQGIILGPPLFLPPEIVIVFVVCLSLHQGELVLKGCKKEREREITI